MIPFTRIQTEKPGEPLHFLAANGYPSACYGSFFKALNRPIWAPQLRPLWPQSQPAALGSWLDMAADLHEYVCAYQPQVVAGHSMGAVVWLLYALNYQAPFQCIYLIDPALFSWQWGMIYTLARLCRLHTHLHPLIKPTLKRREVFQSSADVFRSYRKKAVFSRFSDAVLHEYIQGAFVPTAQGITLRFSKAWEARIYELGIVHDRVVFSRLQSLSAQLVLLRGAASAACTPRVAQRYFRAAPQCQQISINDAGHLVPFEQPTALAQAIHHLVY